MEEAVIDRTLARLSHEIVERYDGLGDLVLVGIRTRGVPLAYNLANLIATFTGISVPVGELDITLYRDDLTTVAEQPIVKGASIGVDVSGKNIVLVDDVLYTGRTVRAAIDALFSMGRPASIRVAVLVDRGHRELPIRADFVGKNIPTSQQQMVAVHCVDVDGVSNVQLYTLDA